MFHVSLIAVQLNRDTNDTQWVLVAFTWKLQLEKTYQEGGKLLYSPETSDKMNSFGVYPQSCPIGHFYQCSRRRDEMHLIKPTADTSPGVWSLSLRAEPLVSGACRGCRADIQESPKTWQEQTSILHKAWGRRLKHVPLTSLSLIPSSCASLPHSCPSSKEG